LKCQYIYGAVKELGVSQAFAQDSAFHEHGQSTGQLEPLTRITLADDPQKWDRDLELMRGTTAVGMVALGVAESSSWIQLFSSSALGALLGLFIPWLTIPKTRRLRTDWLAGALTGAAIVLSIWASLLVFGIWRSRRFADRPRQPSRWLVVPALAIVHFAIVLGVCRALLAWISSAA
jgi:hypothetical protein